MQNRGRTVSDSDHQTDSDIHSPSAFRALHLRLCWLIRALLPQALGLAIIYWLLRSISRADVEPWTTVDYHALLRFEFSSMDLDALMQRLTTLNIVTKVALAALVLLLSAYGSDILTTSRRKGWCLIAPFVDTSRFGCAKAWLLVSIIALALPCMLVALVLKEACTFATAFKILVGIDLLVLVVAMAANRTLEAYLLQVPLREQRREKHWERRRERSMERRAERERRQEKRRQRREELRAHRAELQALHREYETLGAEIRGVERSNHPPEVVADQISRLRARRAEIAGALREVQIRYPDRT